VVEASLGEDPEHIVHACMMDPLTGAALTLEEIRDMVIEMFDIQREWLPQFEGKSITRTPTISVPENVQRAEVPVDPALAVAHRFGELNP
jgi:alpha-galactosidase